MSQPPTVTEIRYHAPYMEWAKTRPAPDIDLAGSNILACSVDDLPDAREAVAFNGANDNGYRPLMAPEQRDGAAGTRSDVYALGAILRDLAGAPAPGRARKPLTSIILRAMGSDPGERYASPGELAADVRRFLDGAAVSAHVEGPLEQAARLARTYRTPIVLVLTYLAVRMLLLFWRA